jgi:hypothetical protein
MALYWSSTPDVMWPLAEVWVIRTLLLLLALLVTISDARADQIGIYSDATGSSCVLSAGVNSTATLLHKFATGATGSRFRVDLSTAPGSIFYSFSTSFTPVGTLTDDQSLSYGQCLSGSFAIGTMVSYLAAGQIHVRAANGTPNILYTNCAFADIIASGGQASVGNEQCMAAGTQSATWGQVKSLYR